MGKVLLWAKARIPHGQWEKWLSKHKFKKTWAWKACSLKETVTLNQVQGLGMTEALVKYGIEKAKPKKATANPPTRKSKLPPQKSVFKLTDQSEPVEDETGVEIDDGDETAEFVVNNEQVDLADEEDQELKHYQSAIRKETPHTKAISIRNALERLGESLTVEDIDRDLRDTFGQIADLASKLQALGNESA